MVVTLAAVGLGAALVGAAAAGDGEDVFYACAYEDRVLPGTIRTDDPPTCRGRRELVTWNATGPQGEQGPPGPAFTDVTFRERSRSVTVEDSGSEGPAGASAGCEAGEAVVGGGLVGYDRGVLEPDLRLINSGPYFDGSISGWNVDWVNVGEEPITLRVTVVAMCVPGAVTLVRE